MELANLDATRRLAEAIARNVSLPMTIALSGTLGAGKTQWVRFFCESLGVPPDLVTSPTYVLVQFYRGAEFGIYHLDYYRLENEAQAWDLGIDEWQAQPVVLLVEWADKFPQTLAEDRIVLELDQTCGGSRRASLTATGPISEGVLQRALSTRLE